MIKLTATVNLANKFCKICRRTIKAEEQYLKEGTYAPCLYHVSCIMEMCGKQVGRTVWKTEEEVQNEIFLRRSKKIIADGGSLLDA